MSGKSQKSGRILIALPAENTTTADTERIVMPLPKIHVVLDRLRSAHNVGNIFRLADAVGAVEVVCCGYTAAPPHPKLEKTAMGTDKTVPFRWFPDGVTALNQLKSEGCLCVAVDTVENAEDAWDFQVPEQDIALVFGNEALGISEEALSACEKFIQLPMFGGKSSINVGNCAAVVLYLLVRNGSGQK